MMIIHELKTWPQYFQPVYEGIKRFELRHNDRDFKVGDQLLLKEWKPTITFEDGRGTQTIEGHYTGRELLCEVDYIMKAENIYFTTPSALNAKYVIMSIRTVP